LESFRGGAVTKRNDPDYYAHRLRAEREAAAAATCDQARAAHLVLADEYEHKLAQKGCQQPVSDAIPADHQAVAEA